MQIAEQKRVSPVTLFQRVPLVVKFDDEVQEFP